MSKIFTDSTVDQRVSVLEKYLEDLSLHRDSRKGLDGARGPQGEPSTVPGPQGPAGRDGRDADITQVVEAALKRVREEFDAEYKILAEVVRHALVTGGVLDENGKAILVAGPKGDPGTDSTVPGLPGKDGVDGKSIVGPAGRDAKIVVGDVTAGEKASVTVREENGVHVFDFVLPRGERGEVGPASVVPGPEGREGPEGQAGTPGVGLEKSDVVEIIIDMKKRGTLK